MRASATATCSGCDPVFLPRQRELGLAAEVVSLALCFPSSPPGVFIWLAVRFEASGLPERGPCCRSRFAPANSCCLTSFKGPAALAACPSELTPPKPFSWRQHLSVCGCSFFFLFSCQHIKTIIELEANVLTSAVTQSFLCCRYRCNRTLCVVAYFLKVLQTFWSNLYVHIC